MSPRRTSTSQPAGKTLPRVLQGPRLRLFGWLIANGVGQAGAAVGTALLVRHGFDTLVSAGQPLTASLAFLFGGGLIASIVVTALLRWRAQIDAEKLGQGYVHAVRMMLFRHLSRIGATGARQMSKGAIVLRFVGDLSALRQWVSLGLARLTVSGIAALLAVGALSFVEPVVAVAVAIAVAIALILALLIGPRLRVRTRESRRRRGRLAAMLNDRVAHIGVVEAFGQEETELGRFEKLSHHLRHSLVVRSRVVGLLRALSEASGSVASACALFVGAAQVAVGQASPGAVVAAMVVAGLLAPRLQDLGRVYEYWNGALIAREKQEQLLALGADARLARVDDGLPLENGPGRIELNGVSLGAMMDKVSVTIEAGERVAVVGPNGAGKSHLLRVLAGIIDPDGGRVLLDGQDIGRARWGDVRRAFALCSPDLPLLRGSLRFNLTYGGADPSDDAINGVLAQLGLDSLVARSPRGLKTRVSENGEGLSTGERARIALARALLAGPRVLLLDEADANLDRDAGGLLNRALSLFDGTVVFVTHDPGRAATADRVLHLEGGALREVDMRHDPAANTAAALRLVS